MFLQTLVLLDLESIYPNAADSLDLRGFSVQISERQHVTGRFDTLEQLVRFY
jgi:hypothetical protein